MTLISQVNFTDRNTAKQTKSFGNLLSEPRFWGSISSALVSTIGNVFLLLHLADPLKRNSRCLIWHILIFSSQPFPLLSCSFKMSVFLSKHGSMSEKENGIVVSDTLADENRLTAQTRIVLLLLNFTFSAVVYLKPFVVRKRSSLEECF